MAKTFGPLMEGWGRLNPVQKAAASLMGLVALIALVVGISMASRPEYSVLFSNLAPNDANQIVEKLKEQKTEYRVSAGGTAIEVPSDKVYDLRLTMAGAGLPAGGTVGFEIFDKSAFGMTEFTQKLNYQRALQGELAKTIGQLSGVDQARVLLAMPEQSLYSDKQNDPTASVMVKLKSGGQLAPDQVAAVTHLVAASVEGMKASDVAVSDTAGNLLSDAGSGSLTADGLRLSSSQMDMQKQYEQQVSKDLQAMLEKVLGPGKAIVRVNARMNFDAKQTDREIYEPNASGEGVLVSQDQTEETYSGAAKNMPGGAALAANIGGANGAVSRTAATGDNYSRTQTNAKYSVGKRVEHITEAPGKVERMSVAVLMDGQVTPAISATIRNAVSTAVGIDSTRGDQVTVDSVPFDNTAMKAQDADMQKAARTEMMMSLAKYAAALLLAIAFLLFMRGFLRSWRPATVTRSYADPISLAQAEALEMISDAPAEPKKLAGPRPAEIAQGNPEGVANLVRTWLAESDAA
ncbi:MAG TPA: flagellar basal-body MS-ring/collar protein FliF [Armatimonadota bacterium]